MSEGEKERLVAAPKLSSAGSEEFKPDLLLGQELGDVEHYLDAQLGGLTQLAQTPSLLSLLLPHSHYQLHKTIE